jgi:hypothetical protein
VLLPNPFYHVYASSALAVGAEPVFVPATAATGFMPDYGALDAALLDRTVFCFLNSPANPQGAAADAGYLAGLLKLARAHDFVVGFDECYSEIYDAAPPAGALQAAAALGGALDHLLVFHSLSKRSSAPGLRCGFVAGDAPLIDGLDLALRVGGAGVSLPILAAGTRLWRDEAHVEANRAYYRRNFDIAARILGNRFGFRKPDGGFFLWLDVGDGEAAALRLWREAGVRVLPGTYMAETGPDGVNPGSPLHPCRPRLRRGSHRGRTEPHRPGIGRGTAGRRRRRRKARRRPMAMRSNSGTRDGRTTLLPSGTQDFFKRRGIELAGLALAVFAFALLIACLTYNPQDPSWNDATGRAVSNPLGHFGSYSADVMMQSLGLAALLTPLVLFAWGWRLLRERLLPTRWWWRLAAFPAGLMLLAMALETLPKPATWPLDNKLGGFVGDLMLWHVNGLLGLPVWAMALLAFPLGLAGLFFALGLTAQEWRVLRDGVAWVFGGARRGIASAMERRNEVEPGEARAARRERQRIEPMLDEDDAPADDLPPAPRLAVRADAEEDDDVDFVAAPRQPSRPGKRARSAAQGRLDLGPTGTYETPPLTLLDLPKDAGRHESLNRDALEKNARLLEGCSTISACGRDREGAPRPGGHPATNSSPRPAPRPAAW